jgi:hypothetical protein
MAVIAMFGLCGAPHVLGQSTWNSVSGGNWNQNSNWTGGTSFPNGFNETATIQQDISGPTTINLNAATMLNRLIIGDSSNVSPSGYTIAPSGGSLTFRNAQNVQARPAITSMNGANAITAPITVDNAVLSISNSGGGTLSLAGISNARGGGYRFSDTNTKVSSGLTSVNGIASVFATYGTTDWATYDPITGSVGQLGSYGTLAGSGSTTNVTQAGNATLSGNTSMNSFRWTTSSSSTLNLGGSDMTIVSGGFLRSSTPAHNTTISSTNGRLMTPAGVPLTLWQNSSNLMTINAPVAVDGMNVAGRVTFTNSANNFGSGEINLISGNITAFNYLSPSLSNNVNIGNGNGTQFQFNPASPSTMTLGGTVTANSIITGNANGAYSIGTLAGYGSSSVTPITVTNTLAPGDGGTGTLDLNNNLTLSASSTYRVQLGGTTPGDGKGLYDQVNMTLNSGSITLELGASIDFSLADAFAPTPLDNFFILTRADSSPWGNYFSGAGEGDYVTFGTGADTYTGQITYQANWTGSQSTSTLIGGNDVAFFNIQAPTAVPEPASAFTVLALFSGGVLHRRKRVMRR